jgi:hypothetical protein
VIYADILFSSLLAAVLEIYSQHFYTSFNATVASFHIHALIKKKSANSVADPDPGSGDFLPLDPGSGDF